MEYEWRTNNFGARKAERPKYTAAGCLLRHPRHYGQRAWSFYSESGDGAPMEDLFRRRVQTNSDFAVPAARAVRPRDERAEPGLLVTPHLSMSPLPECCGTSAGQWSRGPGPCTALLMTFIVRSGVRSGPTVAALAEGGSLPGARGECLKIKARTGGARLSGRDVCRDAFARALPRSVQVARVGSLDKSRSHGPSRIPL